MVSAFDGGGIFAGRRNAPGGIDRPIPGYYASLFGIYDRADVSDPGDLSDVYAA